MNDQCRDETPRGALTEQLELDLPDDGSFFCTRACEGVSVSPHQVGAAVHLSEEDVPQTDKESSCARQSPMSEEEFDLKIQRARERFEQAYEQTYKKVFEHSGDIMRSVMGALWQSLEEAGVSKHRIASEYHLVQRAVLQVIDNIWDMSKYFDLADAYLDPILKGQLPEESSETSAE